MRAADCEDSVCFEFVDEWETGFEEKVFELVEAVLTLFCVVTGHC